MIKSIILTVAFLLVCFGVGAALGQESILSGECLIGTGTCEVFPGQANPSGGGNCRIMGWGSIPVTVQGSQDYWNLVDHSKGTTAAAEDDFIVPIDMKIYNLLVSVVQAPGGAADDDVWSIAVLDDNVATVMACDITGTETSCTYTATEPVVVAGSSLTVFVTSDNGVSDPDSASKMSAYFCMTGAPPA
jgi:hypothetical protein